MTFEQLIDNIKVGTYDVVNNIDESVVHIAYPHAYGKLGVTKGQRQEALKLVREKQDELNSLFKTDLIAAFELEDHPQANALFDLAWEQGHSTGLTDVAIYAYEFAALLADIEIYKAAKLWNALPDRIKKEWS